ncbi:MAG: ATP/GTP-binding protein, partial [Candidatus Bathyarchaeia archaeon]
MNSKSLHVMLIGPAGSGKSTLTTSFGKWLEKNMNLKVAYINLDPGCDFIPFKPDFDIREFFTVTKIMKDEMLGPNGAMIKAAELMEKNVKEIVERIAIIKADIKLIDTPGQMEIFVFRPSGPKIAEALCKKGPTLAIYIIDPHLAKTATGLAIATSLFIATQLRLEIPTIAIINKSDTLSKKTMEKYFTDPEYLRKAIIEEKPGALTDLALQYVNAMVDFAKFSN